MKKVINWMLSLAITFIATEALAERRDSFDQRIEGDSADQNIDLNEEGVEGTVSKGIVNPENIRKKLQKQQDLRKNAFDRELVDGESNSPRASDRFSDYGFDRD